MAFYQDYSYLSDYYLTVSDMSEANELVFEEYNPTSEWVSWDNMAYYSTSQDYAILDSLFFFRGSEGGVYDIYSSSHYDPFLLRVYDSEGVIIAVDDGSGSYGIDHIELVVYESDIFYIDASWNQGVYYNYVSINVYEDSEDVVSELDYELGVDDIVIAIEEDDGGLAGSISDISAIYSAADGQVDIDGFTLFSDGQYSLDVSSNTYQSLSEGDILYLNYRYQAIDSKGVSGNATIDIQVAGKNDSPELNESLKNISVVAGNDFIYQLSNDIFSDIDDDSLSYSASLIDGSPLPDWLKFDDSTKAFSGAAVNSNIFTVRVTAADENGATVYDDFSIDVKEAGEILISTEDSDLIVGGDQNDIVKVSYLPSQYIYSNNVLSGSEGDDELFSIEYIGFGYDYGNAFEVDVRIEDLVDPDGVQGDQKSSAAQLLDEISDLYLAYFGRAPDAAGLTYWFKELYAGSLSIENTAVSFSYSQEYQDMYPEGTSDRSFIENVYHNLFGRSPDDGGWDYWEEVLNNGLGRDVFLLAVINGAYAVTGSSVDKKQLDNKHQVSIYYAEQSAIHTEDGFDTAINALLKEVSGDDSSVESAKSVIDYAYENDISLIGIVEDKNLLEQLWN